MNVYVVVIVIVRMLRDCELHFMAFSDVVRSWFPVGFRMFDVFGLMIDVMFDRLGQVPEDIRCVTLLYSFVYRRVI